MSSLVGFFGFSIELSNADVSEKIRLKLPRHINEPSEYFYSKILAYLHSYKSGHVLYNWGNEPVIEDQENPGRLLCYVGKVDSKGLYNSQKAREHGQTQVYFYEQNQIESFCKDLKGTKTNWVSRINFFHIKSEFLEKLMATEKSSSQWSVTIIDSEDVYFTANDQALFTSIERLDIWSEFQKYLEGVDPD